MNTILRPAGPAGVDHLCYTVFETPFGSLYVAYAGGVVCRGDLAISEERFVAGCHEHTDQAAEREPEAPERLRRVFCRPTCYAGRRMKPEHRVLFATAGEARQVGFRPCKICRPA